MPKIPGHLPSPASFPLCSVQSRAAARAVVGEFNNRLPDVRVIVWVPSELINLFCITPTMPVERLSISITTSGVPRVSPANKYCRSHKNIDTEDDDDRPFQPDIKARSDARGRIGRICWSGSRGVPCGNQFAYRRSDWLHLLASIYQLTFDETC